VAREYEPVAGQWYENIDENESFRVLRVDEDSELIEIEYLDGDIEELDLEGGSAADDQEEEEEEKEEKDEIEETWDEDEDEDDEDWDEDEEEN